MLAEADSLAEPALRLLSGTRLASFLAVGAALPLAAAPRGRLVAGSASGALLGPDFPFRERGLRGLFELGGLDFATIDK